MIHRPTRRDLLKYTAAGALCAKLGAQFTPFPGPRIAAPSAGPSFTLLSHVTLGATGGAALSTSGSTINTTGATLIIIAASWYNGTLPNVTPADSAGNTWTPLTQRLVASTTACQFFYKISPATSATHSFSQPEASYCTFGVAAFSGGSPTFDQQNGASTGSFVGSLATGSITPGGSNALVVSVVASIDTLTAPAIDSGMTAFAIDNSSGNHAMGGIAYKLQTSAAAINPVWSWSGGTGRIAVAVASFLP